MLACLSVFRFKSNSPDYPYFCVILSQNLCLGQERGYNGVAQELDWHPFPAIFLRLAPLLIHADLHGLCGLGELRGHKSMLGTHMYSYDFCADNRLSQSKFSRCALKFLIKVFRANLIKSLTKNFG